MGNIVQCSGDGERRGNVRVEYQDCREYPVRLAQQAHHPKATAIACSCVRGLSKCVEKTGC